MTFVTFVVAVTTAVELSSTAPDSIELSTHHPAPAAMICAEIKVGLGGVLSCEVHGGTGAGVDAAIVAELRQTGYFDNPPLADEGAVSKTNGSVARRRPANGDGVSNGDDAAAAARLAGQNAGAISAWAAAVNKAGGSGAGASQPGGSASGASSGNPFFRS